MVLIAPEFFGLDRAIANSLDELGWSVISWPDRPPSAGVFTKILIRLGFSYAMPWVRQHYDRLLSNLDTIDVDCFLVISPEALTVKLFSKLRDKCRSAYSILYMWDSFKNKASAQKLVGKFNEHFTFDPVDAVNDRRMQYQPLFFLPDIANLAPKAEHNKVLFFGTIHSDRWPVLKRITEATSEMLIWDVFCFIPSKFIYWFRRFLDIRFKGIKWHLISFRAESRARYLERLANTSIVLDIHHPGQRGLTIRTIEAQGAKKKLVTTNSFVCETDFYNPQNILIVDRSDPVIPANFIHNDYVPLDEKIYQRYSIKGWLQSIMKNLPNNFVGAKSSGR